MREEPVAREIVAQMDGWRDVCLLDGVFPVMLLVLEPAQDHYVPRIYAAGYLNPSIVPAMMNLLGECAELFARGKPTKEDTNVG